jgi:hypothetical protein
MTAKGLGLSVKESTRIKSRIKAVYRKEKCALELANRRFGS